jgi:hypothetical protein
MPSAGSRFGALIVGATPLQFAVAALTPTGTIDLGGMPSTPGSSKGGEFSREDFGDAFAAPGNADSIRLTLRRGLTEEAAKAGTSVVIPLSAIPVVRAPLPFYGMTPAYGGHCLTPQAP